MHQENESSPVVELAWHLWSAMPYSEPMLTYLQLHSKKKLQRCLIPNTKHFHKKPFENGICKMSAILLPSDTIWCHRTLSVCYLMAPSHCMNQYLLFTSEVLWYSTESNFTASAQTTFLYNEYENRTFKIANVPPRGQWVKGQYPIQTSWQSCKYSHHMLNISKWSIGGPESNWCWTVLWS